jgi:predicted NACHT family NTPase
MARPSYGPEAKKRAKRLFEVLLLYANDTLECDEVALDSLRPQIQTRWQSQNRLVVRTKVRFLQALTGVQLGQNPLNKDQIKEAIKRLNDYVEVLEDNRPSRGGSETWHFTLKLWHKRQNIEANLLQFDLEWGNKKREDKRIEVIRKQEELLIDSTDISSDLSLPMSISKLQILDWQQLCRKNLESQNHRRLTTNSLTSIDGITFNLDEVYVPLGLVERKQRDYRDNDVMPYQGSRLYEAEDTDNSQVFETKDFLEEVLQRGESQRIAIIGEPGAGKTTLLQTIAFWILENTSNLAVWVSLADLQEKNLEEYLLQEWLKNATRKRRITPEIENEFCKEFNEGRVWLLLDAVDEMVTESSNALGKIASFLNGWVADARVILTCRLNIWDGGKNALENFDTYRNQGFSYEIKKNGEKAITSTNTSIINSTIADGITTPSISGQVGQFIQNWFHKNPELGDRLQTELNQWGRQRIKDAVKNPLRLALLCRTWELGRGYLPNTKAILYRQFVETIYEWKQDRFPTTSSQRRCLNQALGQLALRAFTEEKTKFRLRHRFVCEVLGEPDDGLFQLALQLGWLNQVGISENPGEKVYAFYHPTFQEYFAAQAIEDWQYLFTEGSFPVNVPVNIPINSDISSANDNLSKAISIDITSFQWREVILLWLGRDDISAINKEEFIENLITFKDNCGGYYSYQTYFLAAQGIAEFTDCQKADEIIRQLIKWRFGYWNPQNKKWYSYPGVIVETTRITLARTDRTKAIAAMEEFINSSDNEFNIWNAAYSLGKIFDPGNRIAIIALESLAKNAYHESIRWQAAYSLGKVDPGNQVAITGLTQIIENTKNQSTRRKAAYTLGKIDIGNKIALSTLLELSQTVSDVYVKKQIIEHLESLKYLITTDNSSNIESAGFNQINDEIKSSTIQTSEIKNSKMQPSKIRVNKENKKNITSASVTISSLTRGIEITEDEETKRRRAYRLATLEPGNNLALLTLLSLLKNTKNKTVRKHTVNSLKEVLLPEKLPEVIKILRDVFPSQITDSDIEKYPDFYKLLWHCAENINYVDFYEIWCQ